MTTGSASKIQNLATFLLAFGTYRGCPGYVFEVLSKIIRTKQLHFVLFVLKVKIVS